MVSSGGFGGVFHIRFDGPRHFIKDFAVKRAFDDEPSIRLLKFEKHVIEVRIFETEVY